MSLKDIIRNSVPERIKKFIAYSEEKEYQRISYSQHGEDLLINDLLGQKENGFYVDVGAFHPIQSSNTYFFYLKGWSGINIEPRFGSKKVFDQYRPHDKNLECGISDREGKLEYNSFQEGRYNHIKSANSFKEPENTYEVEVLTLNHVLGNNLPQSRQIDFISIDVEGMELKVLKSIDLLKFCPSLIIIEDHNFEIENKSEIYSYLTNQHYELKAVGFNSSFYHLKIE